MIIKFILTKLSIIFFLVITLPLAQNQWLNLYLFNIENFTIYKLLYYLSGLIFPVLTVITSFNNFTFYNFSYKKLKYNFSVSGKLLLLTTVLVLVTLSSLILSYAFLNFRILFDLIFTDKKYLIDFDFYYQIMFVVMICILLLFKNVKLFIKKFILINFFIISLIVWYSKLNNILFNETVLINNFLNLNDLNSINILFIFSIEIVYFLWSYISHGSYLSDWRLPVPRSTELSPILYIILFYLMITIYYSLLSN